MVFDFHLTNVFISPHRGLEIEKSLNKNHTPSQRDPIFISTFIDSGKDSEICL